MEELEASGVGLHVTMIRAIRRWRSVPHQLQTGDVKSRIGCADLWSESFGDLSPIDQNGFISRRTHRPVLPTVNVDVNVGGVAPLLLIANLWMCMTTRSNRAPSLA
jgi:hypothetical protein